MESASRRERLARSGSAWGTSSWTRGARFLSLSATGLPTQRPRQVQDVFCKPLGAAPTPLGHDRNGKLPVVAIEDFQAVVPAIAKAAKAKHQVDQLFAVNAFAWLPYQNYLTTPA